MALSPCKVASGIFIIQFWWTLKMHLVTLAFDTSDVYFWDSPYYCDFNLFYIVFVVTHPGTLGWIKTATATTNLSPLISMSVLQVELIHSPMRFHWNLGEPDHDTGDGSHNKLNWMRQLQRGTLSRSHWSLPKHWVTWTAQPKLDHLFHAVVSACNRTHLPQTCLSPSLEPILNR